MRRILLSLAALCSFASAAEAADRRYSITDFERVVVEGPYTVRLAIGRSSSAVASGSQQAIDGVTVDVQGTTLRIRRNPNAWGGYPGRAAEPATITLTARNIRSARLLGTGRLDVAGARGLRIDLSVEGTGRLSATGLDADRLSVGMRGSGSLELQGRAKTFTADIQGVGSLLGTGFTADNATIAAATAGEISLTASRTATVTANGVGTVTIAGAPACTVRGPGTPQVRCGRTR